MSEINLNTTLLNNMEALSCLGKKGAVSVYLVRSNKSDHFYVLKHISVPESQRQVDALLFTGAATDNEAAQNYYQQVVSDYQAELDQMEALSDCPNLDCFRSYEIKPKEDAIGFDVYLLSEYRNTLERHIAETPMTQSGAVNLALDLCSALQALREAGLIHRDVTPSNIYLNSQGIYMLGDLGAAKIDQLKFCSMPEGMLSPYSAPELFDLLSNINETIDIYAVGLILYRIYNGNHAPFEDEKTSAKAADHQRVTGQELPAPMFADYEMAEIIRKCCAFKPEDRYQTPDELKEVLVDYMKRNQVGDEPIVPPIQDQEIQVDSEAVEEEVEPVQFTDTDALDEDFKANFSPDNDMLSSLIDSVHRDAEDDFDSMYLSDEVDTEQMAQALQKARSRKSRNKWIPTIVAVVLLLAILGAAVWFLFLKPDTITIDKMEVTGQELDSITVTVETKEDPSVYNTFEVRCENTLIGHKETQPYDGNPNTFTGLLPGSQYTISLVEKDNIEFEGAYSISASTKSTTNVISFTVNRQTVNSLELSFIVDGNEPEEWTVAYGTEGQETKTKAFSGHSVVINGLEADTEYTVTLQDPKDIQLSGTISATGRTLSSVTIEDLDATVSSSTATVSWVFSGATPESWNVTATGTDGYTNNQTVNQSSVVLEGLEAGVTYTILITCDNMEQAASAEFTPDALTILDLTAEMTEEGNLAIHWTTEADSEDIQWLVVSELKGSEAIPDAIPEAIPTEETTVELTDLIPNSTYIIEVQEASGKQVGGERTKLEFTVPAAEKFSDYGFSTGYVSTCLRPAKDNWTVNDLSGNNKKDFTKDDKIAFACESISTPKKADETVSILLVIRDADGNVADYYSGTDNWNEMWNGKKYVGELRRTPSKPGAYTLEIYFNNKIVQTAGSIKFNIS